MWEKNVFCWICFNKVIFKVKIEEISSLFLHLHTCFPNCTKVWLLNIAWQLRFNIPDYTCFYASAILNVVKTWHLGNSVQVCFPSCWLDLNILLLVIWKVSVIKYIGKFQCLWTHMYNKCQHNPTDSGWLCQIEFVSLTQEIYFHVCRDTALQRYQQNNRNVTVSWMSVLYSLVKTDIRAGWKNGTVMTYLKILKLFKLAMEKTPQFCVVLCNKIIQNTGIWTISFPYRYFTRVLWAWKALLL